MNQTKIPHLLIALTIFTVAFALFISLGSITFWNALREAEIVMGVE